MSSRNVYLSPTQRRAAVGLYEALRACAAEARRGEKKVSQLKKKLRNRLRSIPGARVEYAEIVNARTLEDVIELQKGRTASALVAVHFGRTRLIDNVFIKA